MAGASVASVDGVALDPRTAILNLAHGFSIETTPRQAQRIERFADILPRGTRVFVAFIPGEQTAAITALCARLVEEGMVPVPHVPARNFESLVAVERFAQRLHAVGVRQALLVAGGAPMPVGDLESSLEILESGVAEAMGFDQLFVAGHPEGSPDIGRVGLADALARKNAFAARTGIPLTIVTQFGFDAERILAWAEAIGDSGNRLPIRIGVAGPASLTSLLKFARMCGVDASMTMLAKAGGKLFQLVGQAAPDGLIAELATSRQGWSTLIQSLHFYPFGGFEQTALWAGKVARGAFTLHPDGRGFAVGG